MTHPAVPWQLMIVMKKLNKTQWGFWAQKPICVSCFLFVGNRLYSASMTFSVFQVLLAQSCPTVCDSMDCSPQGSSLHGVLQVKILEWVATPFLVALHDPGIEPWSPVLQEDSLPTDPQGSYKGQIKFLLIGEGRGCRDKGGTVKKQQCNLGAESWFSLKRYT